MIRSVTLVPSSNHCELYYQSAYYAIRKLANMIFPKGLQILTRDTFYLLIGRMNGIVRPLEAIQIQSTERFSLSFLSSVDSCPTYNTPNTLLSATYFSYWLLLYILFPTLSQNGSKRRLNAKDAWEAAAEAAKKSLSKLDFANVQYYFRVVYGPH